jgi:hypothetical protein
MYNGTFEDIILSRTASMNLLKSITNPDMDAVQRRNADLRRIHDAQTVTREEGKILLDIPSLDLSFVTNQSMRIIDAISRKSLIEITEELHLYFHCDNAITMQNMSKDHEVVNSVNGCRYEEIKDHAAAAA